MRSLQSRFGSDIRLANKSLGPWKITCHRRKERPFFVSNCPTRFLKFGGGNLCLQCRVPFQLMIYILFFGHGFPIVLFYNKMDVTSKRKGKGKGNKLPSPNFQLVRIKLFRSNISFPLFAGTCDFVDFLDISSKYLDIGWVDLNTGLSSPKTKVVFCPFFCHSFSTFSRFTIYYISLRYV